MKVLQPVHLYLAALLAVIVPCPARFGYVLVLVLCMDFLLLFGSLMRLGVIKLDLAELIEPVLIVFLFFFALFERQMVVLFSPVIALTLGFLFYLMPLSSFLVSRVVTVDTDAYLPENAIVILVFTVVSLLFAFVREAISYGTFSLPVFGGLKLFVWQGLEKRGLYSPFWGTIPGAFVLFALIILVLTLVQRRFDVVRSVR